MAKVLLYSGGMDSWLIDKIWKPDIKIYIDIEGSYSKEELKRLPTDVQVVSLPIGIYEQENKFVPLRNLYFLMIASNYGDELCLGATAGDWGSKDKTPEFFKKAEEMLNFLLAKQSKVETAKKIKIETKYLYKFKNELVKEYLEQGGSLEQLYKESFSCFTPEDSEPCFNCKPCFRKYVCLDYYGYKFTQKEKEKMFNFVKREIVPRAKNVNATYYSERGSEGKVAEEVVKKLYKEFGREVSEDEQMLYAQPYEVRP